MSLKTLGFRKNLSSKKKRDINDKHLTNTIKVPIKETNIKELSLFSGCGGGLLGTKLLGFKCIGMVEYDSYCQKVLRQRQKDGYLDRCPIFSDIRDFNSSGTAKLYKGITDVITAGFPCQPFSIAGKRQGADDERNMWPETRKTICCVKPRFVFLENVPGLLFHKYIYTIFRDLAEAGYNAKWAVLGAHHIGAKHKRDRLWIVADTKSSRLCRKKNNRMQDMGSRISVYISKKNLWAKRTEHYKPKFCGMHDGVAYRVDRLKAIGNGQVPSVVELAWKTLIKGLGLCR